MVVAVGGEESELDRAGELALVTPPTVTAFITGGAVTTGTVDGAVTEGAEGTEGGLGGFVPGTAGVRPLRPLPPLLVASSTSISSLGIAATFVKNIFSRVCAINTTSSPGLLYT